MPKITKKLKFRKFNERVKKIGGTKNATNQQLERLFNTCHIKYVITLEDQLQEDKAHLLLKQNTIQVLEDDIRLKNNRLRKIEVFGIKQTKILNKREEAWQKESKNQEDRIKVIQKRVQDYIKVRHNLDLLTKRMMSIPQLEEQIEYLKNRNNTNKDLS